MKKPIELKSLLLGAILGATLMFSVAAVTNGSNRTAWEYKVIAAKAFQNELEKGINSAAAEGWEFVSASPYVEQYAFAVLKREKK